MFKIIYKIAEDENGATNLQYALFISLVSIAFINSLKEIGAVITEKLTPSH